MHSLKNGYPDYHFVIAGAPSLSDDFYAPYLKDGIAYVPNRTYTLLAHAHAALVTSGTATLETALFKVPQVVCYKGNWISYQIAKRIITLDYISLVNLIMEREVVKELVQNDLTPTHLKRELDRILGGPQRERILFDYGLLKEKLGGAGASETVARLIVENA
jgi:lipid-A-disaccharide synthase